MVDRRFALSALALWRDLPSLPRRPPDSLLEKVDDDRDEGTSKRGRYLDQDLCGECSVSNVMNFGSGDVE